MATCPKCRSHYSDDTRHCTRDGETLLPDESVAHFDAELKAGDLVGEYRVEKKIGEGGFGKVYAAVHPVIGKRAAIKVLNREYSSSANVVSRFVSEARAVNQIRHRHIIDIFAFSTLPGGLHYFVMELLDGMTLEAWISTKGRMTPAQALPLLRGVAKALDAAHGAGIAHRDLKPDNVFLCTDDEGGCYPKLLDFGIAKLLGDTQVSHKTRTGAALGTPYYMSPEQCRGVDVDHRTDLYSFGVMTHQLLTGELPFNGESMMDLMFKHTHEPPPPMSRVCPDLPTALDAPVLQMLSKDAAARPPSVTRAIDALIVAASDAGLDIPAHQSGALGLGVSGDRAAAATISVDTSSETAPTVSAEPAKAATAMPPSARTLNEERIPGSGSRTWLVAAAALLVGVGITFALTRDSSRGHPAPRASSPASPGTATAARTESTATESAPDIEPLPPPRTPPVAAPPPVVASTSASATPSVGAGPPPVPKDKALPAPPPIPKPKTDVPDDLEPL